MSTERDDYPGMPRWVKISGLVALVVVLVLILVLLFAGGDHGPGRHAGLTMDREDVTSQKYPSIGLGPTVGHSNSVHLSASTATVRGVETPSIERG